MPFEYLLAESRGWKTSFTNTAVTAILRTVLAILTILAGFAGIGTGAGSGENVEWNLIEEENRQHDLRRN
jgi:hypothetical protein